MADRKLDMFKDVLPNIDKRNKKFYGILTEEQAKEFSPWLVQRWVSSVEGDPDFIEHYLIMTNELSNVGFGDISLKDHKELHWLSLQIVGVGRTQRHAFIAPPKGAKKTKLREWLAEQFVGYSDQEIELWIILNGIEGVKDLAEQCNLGHKEIESLVKELKN